MSIQYLSAESNARRGAAVMNLKWQKNDQNYYELIDTNTGALYAYIFPICRRFGGQDNVVGWGYQLVGQKSVWGGAERTSLQKRAATARAKVCKLVQA
jgi:hypothetical protein